MNPQTLQLVLMVEDLAVQGAKLATELRHILSGSNTRPVEEILSEADAKYREILERAKNVAPEVPPQG